MRGWLKKTVQIITGLWRDVMLLKRVSRLDLWKYYSLYGGTYFAGSDTILVFKLFRGVFRGGTRLAMPKTTPRAGLIVIEAWFRGY